MVNIFDFKSKIDLLFRFFGITCYRNSKSKIIAQKNVFCYVTETWPTDKTSASQLFSCRAHNCLPTNCRPHKVFYSLTKPYINSSWLKKAPGNLLFFNSFLSLMTKKIKKRSSVENILRPTKLLSCPTLRTTRLNKLLSTLTFPLKFKSNIYYFLSFRLVN